jgi:hypothetical protein
VKVAKLQILRSNESPYDSMIFFNLEAEQESLVALPGIEPGFED